MGTSLVTGLFSTLHPGQHGKVALIGGVGTMMGTSVGCSGVGCSGTLGLAYASMYEVWSDDLLAYLSSDSAQSI